MQLKAWRGWLRAAGKLSAMKGKCAAESLSSLSALSARL